MFELGFVIFLIGCSVGQASSREQMTMHNKQFKIAAMPFPPLIVIRKDKNGQDIIGGLLGKFLAYLKGARNCTFKVVTPHDGLENFCYGKNNCTGMIGLVNRNEVDFAIGIIEHDNKIQKRLNKFTISGPFFPSLNLANAVDFFHTIHKQLLDCCRAFRNKIQDVVHN